MSAPAIRIEGLGKRYRIGELEPYGLLRDRLAGVLHRDRSERAAAQFVWALRDVSLEIAEGEVVGIVGANGAGKSTLLKILTRVTEPTEGRALIWGRVGSLLEVGTGFHGELTGRENIALNGAILGMRRADLRRRFDAIVDFAEIGRFLDTPVKHYSSGMYVRLAFAVAAHLEPDVLLVDEVLAVGDAAFQRKCLGKLDEVADQGRTVLFVSHSMTAVGQLCTRAVQIGEGRVLRDGPPQEVISSYLARASAGGEVRWDSPRGAGDAALLAVRVLSEASISTEVPIDRELNIEVDFELRRAGYENLLVDIQVHDEAGITVLSSANTGRANLAADDWWARSHAAGRYRARCTFPANFFNDHSYYISVFLVRPPNDVEAAAEHVLRFDVTDTGAMRDEGIGSSHWAGVVRPRLAWTTRALG